MTIAAVTPSDTVALPVPGSKFWAGVAGNIALSTSNQQSGIPAPVVVVGFPAGQWVQMPAGITWIFATSTTATGILIAP
jgi:hypothetical protein